MSIEKPKPPEGRITPECEFDTTAQLIIIVSVFLVLMGVLLTLVSSNAEAADSGYNRSEWGIWRTKACKTTREYVLIAQGTDVVLSSNGCDVKAGVWIDPYTGNPFTSPKAIDIDHVVPPRWAIDHGAARWTRNQKLIFANDLLNLTAVGLSVNRSKGEKGAREWLPPRTSYQCEYIRRFDFVVRKHNLRYKNGEGRWMTARLKECKKK